MKINMIELLSSLYKENCMRLILKSVSIRMLYNSNTCSKTWLKIFSNHLMRRFRIINSNPCIFYTNIECWGISDITCILFTRESYNNNSCILHISEDTYHFFHYEFLESLIRF